METQSLFSWATQALAQARPPGWMVDEALNRLLLLLNHVLQQEPLATERLARIKGQRIEACWQHWRVQLQITPAGLFERVLQDTPFHPDLRLTLQEASPFAALESVWQGQKPKVHIEGDVRLAAEVNWLIDHVRWDAHEDVARCIGDGPAQVVMPLAHSALAALKRFVRTCAPVAAAPAPAPVSAP